MIKNYKKTIVISAINLNKAGPLSVLEDCLSYLSENLSGKFNIIALIHDQNLINFKNITYYEFKDSKKSWLKRIYYEYFYFKKLSKILNPYLWLSLHDITPNITSEIRAVYCHNPSPFYNISLKEAFMEPEFALFVFFYKYLYAINIKKNNYVIVQQDWIRKRFEKVFGIDNVIVARPHITKNSNINPIINDTRKDYIYKFFYPAFPRVFKNFEVICKASEILVDKRINNFEVYFTIAGTENTYAKDIYRRFKHLTNIKFLGILSRNKVYEIYNKADCLIFPSKLETWGLPITEFKAFKKPILLANLEYAHETIGNYEKVKFFNPDNPEELVSLMSALIDHKLTFDYVTERPIAPPFSSSWEELFGILLKTR